MGQESPSGRHRRVVRLAPETSHQHTGLPLSTQQWTLLAEASYFRDVPIPDIFQSSCRWAWSHLAPCRICVQHRLVHAANMAQWPTIFVKFE